MLSCCSFSMTIATKSLLSSSLNDKKYVNNGRIPKKNTKTEYGGFCPTPQKGSFQALEGERLWDWGLCQGLNDRGHVNGGYPLRELIAATQVDMLPGDRGDVGQQGGASDIPVAFFVGKEVG